MTLSSATFLAHVRRRLLAFWVVSLTLLLVGWVVRPAAVATPTVAQPAVMQNCPAEPSDGPRSPARRILGRVLLDNADSWRAMRAALEVLRESPERPLYSTIFERCIKFQYPPSSLLSLDVLGVLLGSAGTSNALLNALAYVLLVAMLWAILRIHTRAIGTLGPPTLVDGVTAVLFPLIAYPVLKSIELGQIQTWLNGMLALAAVAFLSGRKLAAGVIIGAMATIKPQMGLFLVWALVRRDVPFAKGIGITALVVSLLALVRYGLGPHLEYLQVLSSISRHGESYFANQSFNGLLLRAMHLGPNVFFDRSGFAPYHPLVRYGTLVTSLLLIAYALFARAKSERARGVDFGIAALCFTIASPIAWEHHYGVMPLVFVLAVAALLANGERDQRLWILLGVAWVLTSIRFAATHALYATSYNFLQSYMYFGALLLLGTLHAVRARVDAAAPAGAAR